MDILPQLPPNAKLIFRKNACYDWCASSSTALNTCISQTQHRSRPVMLQGHIRLGASKHRRRKVHVFPVHEQLRTRPFPAIILSKHRALDATSRQPNQRVNEAGGSNDLLRRCVARLCLAGEQRHDACHRQWSGVDSICPGQRLVKCMTPVWAMRTYGGCICPQASRWRATRRTLGGPTHMCRAMSSPQVRSKPPRSCLSSALNKPIL